MFVIGQKKFQFLGVTNTKKNRHEPMCKLYNTNIKHVHEKRRSLPGWFLWQQTGDGRYSNEVLMAK